MTSDLSDSKILFKKEQSFNDFSVCYGRHGNVKLYIHFINVVSLKNHDFDMVQVNPGKPIG